MSERSSPWLQTYSGATFRLLAPKPEMFLLEDIAHHLACSTRFSGATRVPYSIGQHCVHVSYLVPPKFAREGLGHEIAEPYTGDITYPMKCVLEIEAPGVLKRIERRIEAEGSAGYGLKYPWPAEVKRADIAMLVAERNALMNEKHELWDADADMEELREDIARGEGMLRENGVWTWDVAERRFLDRWTELVDMAVREEL